MTELEKVLADIETQTSGGEYEDASSNSWRVAYRREREVLRLCRALRLAVRQRDAWRATAKSPANSAQREIADEIRDIHDAEILKVLRGEE